MPTFARQRHLVARPKKRQKKLGLEEWGMCEKWRLGNRENEDVFSPWKHGALSCSALRHGVAR